MKISLLFLLATIVLNVQLNAQVFDTFVLNEAILNYELRFTNKSSNIITLDSLSVTNYETECKNGSPVNPIFYYINAVDSIFVNNPHNEGYFDLVTNAKWILRKKFPCRHWSYSYDLAKFSERSVAKIPADSSFTLKIISGDISNCRAKEITSGNVETVKDTLLLHTSAGIQYIYFTDKTQGSVCVANEKEEIPTFSLAAYPNPFNPQTRVSFSLASSSVVSLVVVDVTGKEITSIYSSKRLAAGAHEVFWDGSGMASGIYLIQLKTADGTAESIKVTLLK